MKHIVNLIIPFSYSIIICNIKLEMSWSNDDYIVNADIDELKNLLAYTVDTTVWRVMVYTCRYVEQYWVFYSIYLP